MTKLIGYKGWEKLPNIHDMKQYVLSDFKIKKPTPIQGEYVNLSEIPSEKLRATFMPQELSDKFKTKFFSNEINQLKRND